jgi:hypothetical protein
VVGLAGWPVGTLLAAGRTGLVLGPGERVLVAACFAAALAAEVAAFVVTRRLGIRALARL